MTTTRHQLAASDDGTRVVHYSPTTESLSVYKLPLKSPSSQRASIASTLSVTPVESLTLRISPVSALCLHPSTPVIIGIPLKNHGFDGYSDGINRIPKGPSTKPSTSMPKGPASTFPKGPNEQRKMTQTVGETTSNSIINAATKNKILLTLYSYYTRPLVSTPLTIEVNASGTLSPWCMKYSPCGKYFALHTRSYEKVDGTDITLFQLFLFDVENNYSFITSIKLEAGVEALAWNQKSDYILAAGSDGSLYTYYFDCKTNELSIKKTLNLSSSSLSSISYSEPIDENDKLSQLGIIVGTKDGNTIYIDPATMCCTHTMLSEINLPVLNVSMGGDGINIITYFSYTNEPAHVVRILAQENKAEEIGIIKDIYPMLNKLGNYSPNDVIGCGVLCTKSGVVVSVKKDGKVCFETLQDSLYKEKAEIKTETTKSNAKINNENKNNNLKKRSHIELFGDNADTDKRTNVKKQYIQKNQQTQQARTPLANQKDLFSKREYWDSRGKSIRGDRSKDTSRSNRN